MLPDRPTAPTEPPAPEQAGLAKRFYFGTPDEPIPFLVGPHGETVGRLVSYVNLGDKDGKYPPQVIPSVITKINEDGTVSLKHFYPTGIFDSPSVPFSDDFRRGHWTWPPQVR